MEAIKQTLFTGWHFMRWLRLAFGIFFTVQAIQTPDTLSVIAAAFFLLTALTNMGCCGAGTCATPRNRNNSKSSEDIPFKAIKDQ